MIGTRPDVTVLPLRVEDAERYFEGLQYMASEFGIDTVHAYPTIEAVHHSIVTPPNPRRERYGIWLHDGAHNDGFAGSINLTPQEPDDCRPRLGEVGYWLDRRYVGRGVMTVAVRAIAHYGLHVRQPHYDEIIAHVLPGNGKSQRVLARAGFVLYATAPKDLYYRLAADSDEGPGAVIAP